MPGCEQIHWYIVCSEQSIKKPGSALFRQHWRASGHLLLGLADCVITTWTMIEMVLFLHNPKPLVLLLQKNTAYEGLSWVLLANRQS